MKKRIHTILATMLLSFLLGCRDCPPCKKDMVVPTCFEEAIPYQIGDTLRFANAMGDTMTFHCVERKHINDKQADTSLEGEGCCPSYIAQFLYTSLKSDSSSLVCSAEFSGVYRYRLYISIDNSFDSYDINRCDFSNETTEEVTIAARKYHDVLELWGKDTLYVNPTNEYHSVIVGFKVNGVEWGIID